MKKIKYLIGIAIASICVAFVGAKNVHAEAIAVSDYSSFVTAANDGGEVELGGNITLTDNVFVRKPMTLDLKGYSINTDEFTIVSLSDFEMQDTAGSGKVYGTSYYKIQAGTSTTPGKFTLTSGTIEGTSYYGLAVPLRGEAVINGGKITAGEYAVVDRGVVTINGGEISSTANSPSVTFAITEGGSFEMNGGVVKTTGSGVAINLSFDYDTDKGSTGVINGGSVEAPSDGTAITIYKNSSLTVNGGTITGGDAIFSNGSVDGYSSGNNAKITITDGEITALTGVAIYIPQKDGITNISGGTITGQKTALEIRAGTLEITGGTLISLSDTYEVDSNKSGTTTVGAAVAVSQHATALPINVHISGGTFRAQVPFCENNPEQNSAEDIAKVVIVIEGNGETEPTFLSDGDQSVSIENANTGFIRGGLYSHSVDPYLFDGYLEVVRDDLNGLFEVVRKNIPAPNTGDNVVFEILALVTSCSGMIMAVRQLLKRQRL